VLNYGRLISDKEADEIDCSVGDGETLRVGGGAGRGRLSTKRLIGGMRQGFRVKIRG